PRAVFGLRRKRALAGSYPQAQGRVRKADSQPAHGHRARLLRRHVADRDGGEIEAASGDREDLGAQRAQNAARSAHGGGYGMTCDELKEMMELYSLGVLEGEERDELDAHLARDCETCRKNLKGAVAMNAALLTFVPEVRPPRRLKRRIL